MKYLKISNIKININTSYEEGLKKALKVADILPDDIIDWNIEKVSIDARKKPDIQKVCTYGIHVNSYNKKRKNITVLDKKPSYNFDLKGNKKIINSPVVVGFGPAGMFASYMLAKNGYKPIIIERGSKVDIRTKKVDDFWNNNQLDTECNVQFGEGGAGTFSDGKLNTGIKDKENRINLVLETFVKFGAKDSILYENKPHIGTDVLTKVVKNMREYIESKGGKFFFDTKVTNLIIKDNKIQGIELNNNRTINCEICILAIGHSARDTFEMLNKLEIPMEQKPFAIGVRVEHKQSDINKSQYGLKESPLGAAPYKLTYKSKDNRGVYSFCMCPGGYVVNSSSEKGELAVNGMSYESRDGDNANSAIVVTITPDDFPDNTPLSGMKYQRCLEKQAFNEGNGYIPVQSLKDYKSNTITKEFNRIHPNTKGKTKMANLNNIFPDFVNESIKEGMDYFGTKIEGFNSDDVVLSAIESRTSSPVRILRNDTFESSISGLYPAGEGAGYAGGITSAAIDGIKIFEQLGKTYKA